MRKKMTKTLTAILLVAVLGMSLMGCKKNDTETNTEVAASEVTESTEVIETESADSEETLEATKESEAVEETESTEETVEATESEAEEEEETEASKSEEKEAEESESKEEEKAPAKEESKEVEAVATSTPESAPAAPVNTPAPEAAAPAPAPVAPAPVAPAPDVHTHTFVQQVVEADCYTPKTITTICAYCGYIESVKTEGTTTTHEYEEYVWSYPTCSQDGYHIFTCKYCGDEGPGGGTLKPLPHDIAVEILVEGDCRSPQVRREYCKNCGYTKDIEDWNAHANDHIWVSGTYQDYDVLTHSWIDVPFTRCSVCNMDKPQ